MDNDLSFSINPKKESFIDKHKSFVTTTYTVCFYIGGIYAFLKWLVTLFEVAHNGDMIGFLFAFLLQSLYMAITAFIFAAVAGTISVIILFLPYLVVRGFIK